VKEKTKLYTMRIPLSKYDHLKSASQEFGMPVSQILLQSAFSKLGEIDFKPKRRRPAPKADPVLIRQISAIGNNLNQISRRVNAGDKFDVILHLVTIEKQLKDLLDAYQVH